MNVCAVLEASKVLKLNQINLASPFDSINLVDNSFNQIDSQIATVN